MRWLFPAFMKPLPQKYAMGSDWLAGPVCCDWLNCLKCIIYIAYQFEPDWDPENISEEGHAEPVQARLLKG